MSKRLQDKIAIVTGASSGIGRAIACRFAEEGAHVVIADIISAPLEGGLPTEALIAAGGGVSTRVEANVSRWADVDLLVTETVAAHGRLDIMVNNAAISDGRRLTEADEESWDTVMGVNLKGVFFGCKRAVQQMLTQPIHPTGEARGRIVNLSSQHGMICSPNEFAYGTSKAGIAYMTRQIAADYAKDHIVCNAVAPGKIITGAPLNGTQEDWEKYSIPRTPWPRLGRPADIASAALFLASDEATYITGENLMVDGGWTAS